MAYWLEELARSEIALNRSTKSARKTRLESVAMKLLVIDERPIVLQGGRELLSRAGITDVLQTHDLAVGWRLYRRESPDVMIVELEMQTGAFDGLSFIHKLRLHDQRTPILVYTNQKAPSLLAALSKRGPQATR